MKRRIKSRECDHPDCSNEFIPKKSTIKHCSSGCYYSDPNTIKRIKPISDKRKEENEIYSKRRLIFLSLPENQICPITGQHTTDIHHKMGRIGYADDFARINNIPLLLDERFWIALSREGHEYVEKHPQWAYENGYSLKRLTA